MVLAAVGHLARIRKASHLLIFSNFQQFHNLISNYFNWKHASGTSFGETFSVMKASHYSLFLANSLTISSVIRFSVFFSVHDFKRNGGKSWFVFSGFSMNL